MKSDVQNPNHYMIGYVIYVYMWTLFSQKLPFEMCEREKYNI